MNGLGIATAAALSIIVVRVAVQNVLLSDLRNYLRRTAEMTAALIDGDRHASLVDPSQTGSPEYEALAAPLETLLRVNSDFRFAYSGIVRADTAFFILDGDRSSDRAKVLEPDRPTAGELQIWREQQTVTEEKPSATVWGVGIRAYAPIRNRAGRMVAYVGVTMRADRYREWVRRVDEAAALGLGVAVLLAALSGLRTARNERIRREAESVIERAKESLYSRQKMEALGTLAGGVAHDFNNVLTVIFGHAQMIADDVPADSSLASSASSITSAAIRARDLVRRILMFARPQAETRVPIVVGQVIDETMQLLMATMPSSIEIIWRRPPDPITAIANGPQLAQMLMNLGVNARQALRDDKGQIEISLDQLELETEAARSHGIEPGRYARIVVRDDGIGMSEATRRRIFEPFFTTKPVGQGTGLGLAVVAGLVRSHQGAIEASSTPGGGTTFTVYLPAADPPKVVAPAPEEQRPVQERRRGRGERVLLVDDELMVLASLSGVLSHAGYQVDSHVDAESALAALRADPTGYSVLVTDRTMPRLSGLEVARRSRALSPNLPVILVTGTIQPDDPQCAALSAVVGKPPDPAILVATMEQVMREATRGRAQAALVSPGPSQ